MVSKAKKFDAVNRISNITGTCIDGKYLMLDAIILADVFKDPFQLDTVVNLIIDALNATVTNPKLGEDIYFDLRELKKLKFSSGFCIPTRKKDMRVIYQEIKQIIVYGFGHRWLPQTIDNNGNLINGDFYDKIKNKAAIR